MIVSCRLGRSRSRQRRNWRRRKSLRELGLEVCKREGYFAARPEVPFVTGKVVGIEEHLRVLKEACAWMGVSRGRASRYIRLLEGSLDGATSDEHILAAYESSEIVDLFRLWKPRASGFPGIRERLHEVAAKGSTLREGENSSSSNRARNDAFGLLVAGKLLAADIDVVSVDGVPADGVVCFHRSDVVLRLDREPVLVECKRPRSWRQFPKRVREARRQIGAGGRPGIVALDCSVPVRPSGSVLESGDIELAADRTSAYLEHEVAPAVFRELKPELLGFLLFARVPVMTAVGPDAGPEGGVSYRRDWTSSWVMVANRHAAWPMSAVGRIYGALAGD